MSLDSPVCSQDFSLSWEKSSLYRCVFFLRKGDSISYSGSTFLNISIPILGGRFGFAFCPFSRCRCSSAQSSKMCMNSSILSKNCLFSLLKATNYAFSSSFAGSNLISNSLAHLSLRPFNSPELYDFSNSDSDSLCSSENSDCLASKLRWIYVIYS